MAQPASDRLAFADSILREVLDLPAHERSQVVKQRCGSDAALCHSLLRLISDFDQLGDFLERPAVAAPSRAEPLSVGATLAGRFRILSFAGQGGMGEVYRAEDLELGVQVALKIVRQSWCRDETAGARFRAEIRLARQISHPNVCRIFDLFTSHADGEEIVFFTMEYLEGETLASRLSRQSPTGEEIVSVVSAIGEGLAAAHKEGIVHRDLKPANIMLVTGSGGAERVVIMDFGLAASVAAGGEAPLSDEVTGSPDYMAPEQFLGVAPTPATDIYALGVIAYESFAGQRPFPREPLIRLALRRVGQDAPDLAVHAPGVPPGCVEAIKRALARDPRERYQTAREFVADLRRAAAGTTRRRLIIAGAAAVAVSGSWIGLRFSRWKRFSVHDPVLMIMPCGYSASDSQSRTLAPMVDTLLRTQLAQSAFVKPLRNEQIELAWRLLGSAGSPDLAAIPPPVARHIALRAAREGQTPFILFETIVNTGDRYSLLLSLERLGDNPEYPSATKSWHSDIGRPTDLSEASFEGIKWLRETIGESKADVDSRSRRPEELTTSDWEALREYGRAESAWKQNDEEASILHLKTAVGLDPEFAFAEARLGDHLLTAGRPDEGYPHWSRAAQLLEKRNLTDRESLSIRGRFAADVGLDAKSEEIFSRYAMEYPDESLPLFYKADAVARQGRPEEAEQLLNRAIEKNPRSAPYLLDRAALYLQNGSLDKAESDWRAAAKLSPGGWVDLFEAAIALQRGRFSDVPGALHRMRSGGSRDLQSRAYALLACFYVEQDAGDVAVRWLNDGMVFDRSNGQPRAGVEQKQRLLAEFYLQQGEKGETLKICRTALENISGLQMRMRFGSLLARAGDLQGAMRLASVKGPAWPMYAVWPKALAGEIALAKGQPRQAVSIMQQAVSPAALRHWPDYLGRAAVAAEDYAVAGACFSNLLTRPGLYWLAADQNLPGMLRFAASAVKGLHQWPALRERVDFLQPLLQNR